MKGRGAVPGLWKVSAAGRRTGVASRLEKKKYEKGESGDKTAAKEVRGKY